MQTPHLPIDLILFALSQIDFFFVPPSKWAKLEPSPKNPSCPSCLRGSIFFSELQFGKGNTQNTHSTIKHDLNIRSILTPPPHSHMSHHTTMALKSKRFFVFLRVLCVSVVNHPSSALRPPPSVLCAMRHALRALPPALRPPSSVLRPLPSALCPPSSVLSPPPSVLIPGYH